MPNIRQLLSLKGEFGHLTESEVDAKNFLDKLAIKNGSRTISKSFSFSERTLLESLSHISGKPELIKYFEGKPVEKVVLLFIDITNFSSKVGKLSGSDVTNYLDDYYKAALAIIYEHGGQVEKLMGDGIICVFGMPFIDNDDWKIKYKLAEKCAQELIIEFWQSDKEVKIAFHSGDITYYKVPGDYYEEYTMIGKPLTELYRLESVSVNNSINYYNESVYGKRRQSLTTLDKSVFQPSSFPVDLRGVEYKNVSYIEII